VAVDPTGNDLKRLLADDPGGPVVMLNLLRYKKDGGRESYREYSRALVEGGHLAKVGGELVYAGDGSTALVAEDGQAWDAVLVVRYPSREAFCRMVADPAYQEVTHFRTEALEEAVLQATVPWPGQ
jgi:uncharacterized protein (DUF1330 family)